MPSLVSAPKYAQVATDENGGDGGDGSHGPLGGGSPPMMKKPWAWGAALVIALAGAMLLSGGAAAPAPDDVAGGSSAPAAADATAVAAVAAPPSYATSYAPPAPALRGSTDSAFSTLLAENSKLRGQLAAAATAGPRPGASDEAFEAA